jgi:hypothetical protein
MHDQCLASGITAYYWKIPTWAKKAGFPLRSEALGNDYGEAKCRCDEILNPQLDAWRRRKKGDAPYPSSRAALGTFDWMAAIAKSSPKWPTHSKTHKSYDAVLRLASDHKLKDGRKFGTLMLTSITPGVADRLYESCLL